jgi:hypothetical protein
MRFQRHAAIGCCCLAAACGGAHKLTATQTSGESFVNTVSLNANGVPLVLSAEGGLALVGPPAYAVITAGDFVLQPQHVVNITLGAYPLAVGSTQTCGMPGVGIAYSDTGKDFITGSTDSCTITITAFSGFGNPLEGTFSGIVSSAGRGLAPVTITNGHFKVAAR